MKHNGIWLVALLLIGYVFAVKSFGQVKVIGDQTVTLTAQDASTVIVPPGVPSFLVPLVVDPSSNKSDSIDVVSSQAAAAISLILPNNVEVNLGNATSLGYTFVNSTVLSSDPSLRLSPFDTVGTHTTILFPIGAAYGNYRVKVNTMSVAVDSLITASYQSTSSLRVAVIADAAAYKTGDVIRLTGLAFDGSVPVSGGSLDVLIGDKDHPENDPQQVSLQDDGIANRP